MSSENNRDNGTPEDAAAPDQDKQGQAGVEENRRKFIIEISRSDATNERQKRVLH